MVSEEKKLKFAFAVCTVAAIFANIARSDTPRVVVDIAPIYSIVTTIMGDVGDPTIIVEQSSSPHDFALRPSHARSLQNSDVVFAVSRNLTSWLVDSLESLAKNAEFVFLADLPNTNLLATRDDDEHDHDEGHDHGEIDPHSWLDPENAILWSQEIARVLSEIDPDNAPKYRDNALGFSVRVESLEQKIQHDLAAVGEASYLVYHDAFQYFEERFAHPSLGAITNTEAVDPGPRRLQEVRDLITEANVKCLAVESGFKTGILDAIAPNGGLKVAQMDPLGATLPLDGNLYEAMIRNLAEELTSCLE